jgi:hypothetical protein
MPCEKKIFGLRLGLITKDEESFVVRVAAAAEPTSVQYPQAKFDGRPRSWLL